MLFAKLAHLTRLEACRPAPWTARYLRGRDAMSFSCLTQLRELCIETPPATVFLHLAGISTLTMLECGQWEDEIVTLTQLHKLKITNCQEEAFEGSAVSNLSKLRSLHLEQEVDAVYLEGRVDFSKLQKLPALTKLYLTYAETYLRHLTVSQLRDLDQLKILNISNLRTGRLTQRLMLDLVSMKHLVCLEVAVKGIETSLDHYASALLDLQEMPFLECMSWTCSEGTFPVALVSLARTTKKDRKNKLKGYMIEDSSGMYMATVME